MSKFCTNCGTKLEDDVVFCTGCGQKVEDNGGSAPSNNNPAGNVTVNVSNVGNGAAKKTNGLAIAGFVTSLVSTLLCCGAFNMIGLILSIVGLVKAKDYDGNGKGMAIAGIIICAVVMVLSIIVSIILAISGTTYSEIVNEASSI